jgi:hypothetical protein
MMGLYRRGLVSVTLTRWCTFKPHGPARGRLLTNTAIPFAPWRRSWERVGERSFLSWLRLTGVETKQHFGKHDGNVRALIIAMSTECRIASK